MALWDRCSINPLQNKTPVFMAVVMIGNRTPSGGAQVEYPALITKNAEIRAVKNITSEAMNNDIPSTALETARRSRGNEKFD